MKVGSFVFATDSGLGILAKSFYDHGVVTDAMIIAHGTHLNHYEWYPNSPRVSCLEKADGAMQDFCRSVDAMLFFETPFKWDIIDFCSKVGVKTVLMPMHECFHREGWNHLSNLFLCPSLLDYQTFKGKNTRAGALCPKCNGAGFLPQTSAKGDPCFTCLASGIVNCYHLPVPVDVPYRERKRAEVFVHNAGHGGLKGRNGTAELIAAMRYVKSPIKLIIRTQEGNKHYTFHKDYVDSRIDWRIGNADYNTLWDEGDVFVFPEKFNGLSLPLQEALAAGMLVMASNRFPNNMYLPTAPLVPVHEYKLSRVGPPYLEFSEAVIDPQEIARTIDEFYGRDITEYSRMGRSWAEQNSWEVLKPQYTKLLENLL